MQEAVLKIKELGAPPEGFEGDGCPEEEDFLDEEAPDLWEEYEDAVAAIRRPVTWEEAEVLITCCPTDHMAGIEWTLLHAIESCAAGHLETPEEVGRYRGLIDRCNSDMMRELLLRRLESHLSKRG